MSANITKVDAALGAVLAERYHIQDWGERVWLNRQLAKHRTEAMTTEGVQVGQSPQPEFIRLPGSGHDPYFGLSRSYYYALEKEGSIRMFRLRKKGTLRGIVLIPVEEVSTFLHSKASTRNEAHFTRQ